ncbi:MAG: acyl-CoA dehydrogenase family protein [Hyphomonadaceae bacterium]
MALDADIRFSDVDAMLLETAVAFAAERSPMSRVRALIDTPTGYDGETWREMTSLGWTGLVIPEAHGGSGLSISSAIAIIEACGHRLLASPLMGTLVASDILARHGSDAQQALWLPRLAQGEIAALALDAAQACSLSARSGGFAAAGRKSGVCFGADAAVTLVSVTLEGAPRLALVRREAAQGAYAAQSSMDATQRLYALELSSVALSDEDLLPQSANLDAALRTAAVLQAAEMCGGMLGAIETTLEYLKTRTQFGRLIGAYQALKHPMADLFVQHELLRSLVYAAASNLDAPAGEQLAAMAKVKANEAFAHAGDRAVQFHGGFGFTWDCDAGLYLRRALWSQTQFGGTRHYRRRLAAALAAA